MYSMCCNSTDNDAGDRDIWLSDCLPIFATILLSSKKKKKRKKKKCKVLHLILVLLLPLLSASD